jgi:hypothetical protein
VSLLACFFTILFPILVMFITLYTCLYMSIPSVTGAPPFRQIQGMVQRHSPRHARQHWVRHQHRRDAYLGACSGARGARTSTRRARYFLVARLLVVAGRRAPGAGLVGVQVSRRQGGRRTGAGRVAAANGASVALGWGEEHGRQRRPASSRGKGSKALSDYRPHI